MAKPTTFNGSKILIKVGDGAETETFAHPCLINTTRALQGSVTTVDSVVPDCDDPDAIAWTEREKDAISYTITGEGVMDASSIEEYIDFLESADAKNVQVVIADGDTTNGRVGTGAFHLTEFQVSGARKEKATASITLVSDGIVAWTAVT
jgi:predicted secreted protein